MGSNCFESRWFEFQLKPVIYRPHVIYFICTYVIDSNTTRIWYFTVEVKFEVFDARK